MDKAVAFLSGIDPKVIIVVGVVLAVLAILALVKKAIKLGIVALALALLLGGGGGALQAVTSQYNIKLDGSALHITLAGEKYNIPVKDVDYIEVVTKEGGKSDVIVTVYGDIENSFEVPTIVKGVIKGVANKANIEYTEREIEQPVRDVVD